MTNQSTALRETEREPDRLRPHSAPKSEVIDSTLLSGKTRLEQTERCSPSSPTARLQQSSSSPTPLALYQRKIREQNNEVLLHTINDDGMITKDERPNSPDDDGMSLHSTDIGKDFIFNYFFFVINLFYDFRN